MDDQAQLHDYSWSRAVVMGTWTYEHLPPVPAVENSLKRMAALLTGPLCGWPPDRALTLENRRDLGGLADRLITAFEDVTGVALFYYVGHGQIDLDDQLCLGLTGSRTEANRRAATSLPFQAVRRALLDSPAATKIVILDCCFAGLAGQPGTLAALPDDVLDKSAGTGAYTLAASGAYTTAWYETDPASVRPQTYFTRYFADLVEAGIPGHEPVLRLHPLFTRLKDSLARDQRPVPCARSVDAARDFAFARNAALTGPPGERVISREAHNSVREIKEAVARMITASDSNSDQLLNCLESIQLAMKSPDITQEEKEIYSDAHKAMSSALARLRIEDSINFRRLIDITLDHVQIPAAPQGNGHNAT
jgi:hypothetical protein